MIRIYKHESTFTIDQQKVKCAPGEPISLPNAHALPPLTPRVLARCRQRATGRYRLRLFPMGKWPMDVGAGVGPVARCAEDIAPRE